MPLVATLLRSAAAETYTFKGAAAPGPGIVEVRRRFLATRGGPPAGVATVDVRATGPAQVALLPERLFGRLASSCLTDAARADAAVAPFVRQVSAEAGKPQTVQCEEPGVYVLVVSACGSAAGTRLDGSVTVRYPHGFLSPMDDASRLVYGALALVYAVLSFAMAAISLGRLQQLNGVQRGLLSACMLGELECVLMWTAYTLSNAGAASAPNTLFVGGSIASLWKVCLLIRVILVSENFSLYHKVEAPSGPGLAADALLVAYAGAEVFFRAALRDRISYGLGPMAVLLRAVPAACLLALLLTRSYSALAPDPSADDPAAGARAKSRWVLVAAAIGSFGALATQIAASAIGPDTWLAADGPSNVVFALALTAALLVWRPSAGQGDLQYRPQQQAEEEPAAEPVGVTWGDVDVYAPS